MRAFIKIGVFILDTRYFIGLDLGTSGVKGVLLSEHGEVVSTVTTGFEYYLDGGAKLFDAEKYISACYKTISSLAKAAPSPESVVGICPSGAAGSMLMLDFEGNAIIPIIGWQTKIAKEDFDEFYTVEERAEIRSLAGWPIGPGFPAAYIPAIRKHRPDLMKRAKKILTTPEYLAYRLSGEFGISHSLAMPSTLCDQERGIYNEKLLTKLSISADMLPKLLDKCAPVGTILPEVADELCVSRTATVVIGSFDHPAGAMGSGVYDVDCGLLSLGTSWVVLMPICDRDREALSLGLVDRFMSDGAKYCLMKSIASISDKIGELRTHFFGKISHAEFDELISKSSLGAGGLRFEFAEGDFALAKGHKKEDIARAIIESAAHKLKANLELLSEHGISAEKFTVIGGITNSSVCIKVLSEVVGKPLRVVNGESAGAVGSAMMAAVGVGVFSDEREAFEKMCFNEKTYAP